MQGTPAQLAAIETAMPLIRLIASDLPAALATFESPGSDDPDAIECFRVVGGYIATIQARLDAEADPSWVLTLRDEMGIGRHTTASDVRDRAIYLLDRLVAVHFKSITNNLRL
jgi:hypothetical protein